MFSYEFSLSLLFFWIKGNIFIRGSEINISKANTAFLFFPVGRINETIPAQNITACRVNTAFDTSYFFFAVICGIIALLSGGDLRLIIPAIIFAVIFALLIPRTKLTIYRHGNDFNIDVPFYERKKMLDIQEKIRELIAG